MDVRSDFENLALFFEYLREAVLPPAVFIDRIRLNAEWSDGLDEQFLLSHAPSEFDIEIQTINLPQLKKKTVINALQYLSTVEHRLPELARLFRDQKIRESNEQLKNVVEGLNSLMTLIDTFSGEGNWPFSSG
ncbi:MAG: hypothetical protein MZW92_71910 [Comamonadaceae bacterium]|nr:hypothetical protein [Comamonadaceae bacterium]